MIENEEYSIPINPFISIITKHKNTYSMIKIHWFG